MQLAILMCCMLLISCSKEKQETRNVERAVVGTWELENISCGECVPGIAGVDPPGNGNIIEFSNDGNYLERIQDSVTSQGSYQIFISTECGNPGQIAISRNVNSSSWIQFINFKADRLIIATPHCYSDGETLIYRRLQ